MIFIDLHGLNKSPYLLKKGNKASECNRQTIGVVDTAKPLPALAVTKEI